MNISDLIKESHETAVSKGWWDEEVIHIACSCFKDHVDKGDDPMPDIDCTKCDGIGYTERTLPARTFGDQIALQHSELSEVLEEMRKGIEFTEIYGIRKYDGGPDGGGDSREYVKYEEGKPFHLKPEGIAVEYADLLIRVFDTCGKYNIPLEEALKLKMAYNKTRPHRHGNKKL